MLKKVLISLAIILFLLVGTIGGGVWYYLNQIPREKVDHIIANEDPTILGDNDISTSTNSLGTDQGVLDDLAQYSDITNILVLGVDSPDGIGRSDAMMILTVDRTTSKIKLTSLIRDSYVYIAGHGMDKLNHAYAFGGASLALRAVNTNFDMNITDFVRVNFSSLPHIIDKIGGLDIDLTAAEAKTVGVPSKGLNHLNGAQVLTYSRDRSTAGGDFMRTTRQREVMMLMIKKLMKLTPVEMIQTVDQLLPMVKTSLTSGDILGLGTAAAIGKYDIVQNSFPEDETSKGVLIDQIYYLKWDKQNTINKLHKFIFNK
ncbi:MAG: LCP family protein [Clostridiaceae bacterium]